MLIDDTLAAAIGSIDPGEIQQVRDAPEVLAKLLDDANPPRPARPGAGDA
ncbi:hypothetical protein [Frankia sp. EAN1pec]